MAAIILALMALIVSCVGFYVTLVVGADLNERCEKLKEQQLKTIDASKKINDKISGLCKSASDVLKLNDEIIKSNEELTHYIYTKMDDVK